MATGLLVFGVNLIGGEGAGVDQQLLNALNTLAGGTGVATLATICTAFAGEAVIGSEDDYTAAEDVWQLRLVPLVMQHGPAYGTVADIEAKMDVRCPIFLLGFHLINLLNFALESRQS